MGFMQKQIYFDTYFEVETNIGTEVVPCEVIGIFCEIPGNVLEDFLEGTPARS